MELAASLVARRVVRARDARSRICGCPLVARQTDAASASAHDPDDPAIWVHPTAPDRSLVLGTIKVAAPGGGVAVFGLDGTLRQRVTGIDRPNNIDVEYGFAFGGAAIDIAVVTERYQRRLRVFSIAPDGSGIAELGVIPVLEGAPGESGAPMGIGLYRRPGDGAVFAIVAPKTGPSQQYLWQYRLKDAGNGKLGADVVRRFGRFSGTGEIEAVAVDDEAGHVYYADEGNGLHKWQADPDRRTPQPSSRTSHGKGSRAIAKALRSMRRLRVAATFSRPISSPSTAYHVYALQGPQGLSSNHAPVRVFAGGADSTTDRSDLPQSRPGVPGGLFVA